MKVKLSLLFDALCNWIRMVNSSTLGVGSFWLSSGSWLRRNQLLRLPLACLECWLGWRFWLYDVDLLL